jgi:hypothetical protein
MPRLDLISVPFYDPSYPYHWTYDNLPIQSLIERDVVLNSAIDLASQELRVAAGSAGSISTRIAQSLTDSGNLRTEAVDESLHNIGAHADGTYLSVDYVRMMLTERSKLQFVADDATNMRLEFDTPSVTHIFDEGPVVYEPSDTVTWQLQDNNRVQAQLTIPIEDFGVRWYDVTPAHQDAFDPDYQSFKTTSLATPFVDGSLRIYVNGSRLSESAGVYVPGPTPIEVWQILSYVADSEDGTFVLSAALTPADVIRIDFDQPVA